MKRASLITIVVACAAALTAAAVASAHTITNAAIACTPAGDTQTTVNYSNFTPVNGHRETITATYTNGTVETATPPADQSPPALTIPGPSVPNGTRLGVTLTWAEGSLTVPPVSLSCHPVTPPPPVCVPPQVLQGGTCVTPPPTSVPPTSVPPAPVPPATIVTPPVVTPPLRPPVRHVQCVQAVWTGTLNNQDPRLARPASGRCVAVPIHVTLTGQGLLKGFAVLHVTAPTSIRRIRVTVRSNGHVWTRTVHGHRTVDRWNVADKTVFGENPACGCTFDPAVQITVRANGVKAIASSRR